MTAWPEVAQPGTVPVRADAALGSDGADVLDKVEAFIARFVAFPSDNSAVAVTLWAAHTHVVQRFESTPRLAFLSPEPGSGKSRALEVLELLTPRPLHAVNATSAALFRKVSDEAGAPTILFDEVDTLFGPRAKEHEDIRGMLNAGHRRGATSLRCVVKGKSIELVELPAFCPVALAGLGDLPDTLMSRAVIVRMRRRSPTERVEPFRHRVHAVDGHDLRDALDEWTRDVGDQLEDAWPDMPDTVTDRNADVWEPLLAVADAAGGDWPVRARVAAVAHVADAQGGKLTLGVRLLQDLYTTFSSIGVDALSTATTVEKLCEIDESPWADLRGKPLDARGLARRLKPYDIAPRNVRIGDSVVKGYTREDMHDAWSRYLPLSPQETATSATSATPDAALCAGCGHPMSLVEPGQRTHAGCEVAA